MTAPGPGLHDYPFIGEPPQPLELPSRKRWYRLLPARIALAVIAVFVTALIGILAAASTLSAPVAPSTSDGALSSPAGGRSR
jgi:hypothetical protein